MEKIMLRRSIARLALAAALALPGLAQARDACGGLDMLPRIEAERPGALAAMRAAAYAQPNPAGRFWRIEKPGLAPSFLFGTLHGTADEGVTLPDPARDAIRSARILFAEMTDAEQAKMQQAIADDVGLIADPRGGTLDAALTPELRAAAARVLPDYGLTYDQANVLRPWFLQIALSTPPCVMGALAAGDRVLDAQIMDLGRALGLPVKGMETWREALGFLIDMPLDEARENVALTIANAAEAEDMRRTITRMWQADETMLAWELFRDMNLAMFSPEKTDAMMRDGWTGMVVVRNARFLAAAQADLARGGAFIAVGALHLPGHGGMVEGLRAMGYEVTRIPLR